MSPFIAAKWDGTARAWHYFLQITAGLMRLLATLYGDDVMQAPGEDRVDWRRLVSDARSASRGKSPIRLTFA